jgi:Uncharacterized protein conserved in bacteria (DUF2147)
MNFRPALALAFLVALSGVARADSENTATGFWEAKDDDGNPTAWFLFTQKHDVFSARLVKGFKKPEELTEEEQVCGKCSGEKKGAKIMGLTLFWGMKRDGLKYTGGSVLDPRSGSVYHAKMDLSDDGQDLAVRGYLGIEMFGKTQTWHRLPADAMKTKEIPKEVLAKGGAASKAEPVATEGAAQ